MISSILTIVALAIAANLDNAGVGIAYGARQIHISWLANMMVAVISGIATLVSGLVGQFMSHYIHPRIATVIGAVVMLGVGVWVMIEPLRDKRKARRRELYEEERQAGVIGRILDDPVAADFDKSKTISFVEAMVLGIALAMNSFAGGFDAGVIHLNVIATALFVAIFSYLLLGLSALLGRRYAARVLGHRATLVAGLLLIAIGVHQIW